MPAKRNLAMVALLVVAVGLTGTAGAVPAGYVATLNGPSESPANSSPGTGAAVVEIDTTLLGTYNTPFVTANGGTAAGTEAALAASRYCSRGS